MTHLVPFGDTGWSVWRDVLLRGAGFPVDGLAAFAAPDLAATADRYLAGGSGRAEVEESLSGTVRAESERLAAVAADPLFREAVTWQNPGVLVALDGLVAAGADGPRNKRQRQRENVVAGYWQRYTAKCETIGFFGPVCWGTVEPGDAVTVTPGPGLVRDRRVFLERWAVEACADRLAADPEVRAWFHPVLAPHLSLEGRTVVRVARAPEPVSTAEAEALRRCDGSRPAVAVVDALVADGVVRRAADGVLVLDNLVDRGLLRWDADLPPGLEALETLRERVSAIGDPAARARAEADVERLEAARARVAAAAGDPAALVVALDDLDTEFTALTGRAPRRRPGEPYAGRALCHEETVRDLDVTVGAALLDELAPALALPLHAARWLTTALADAYRDALAGLHADLAASGPVRLADLWFLAQGPLFGSGERPLDAVAADFAERWARVLGDGERFTAAELAPRVAAEFPATAPGWSGARIHSPDLQLCAASAEGLGRGEVLAVLGELHAAWPTFDTAAATVWHPDVAALRDALAADLGPGQVRPLFPPDYPRTGGRLAQTLAGPDDRQLAVADAPGADRSRLLPATATLVTDVDGDLVVTAPDGARWPVLEVFAALVAMHAADAFKVLTDRPHSPRITVDRLVLVRETWRTTTAATGLAGATDPVEQYLAVRRWRAALGLPERVFVRVATELKPTYVDLTSPVFSTRLCRLVRAAGGDVPVTVTELLPGPEHAWLTDAAGHRYVSELRLQVRDPERSRR